MRRHTKKETDRLNNLLRNPSEQARMKQDHDVEEQRLQRLMGAMPDAFLYTYDGADDGNLRLSFRPNPAYITDLRDPRLSRLSGQIWIQPQQKRLAKVDAHILNEIDFGYGLLGRIEKGGRFQIARDPVAESRWKTTMLNVHISGRVVFFKSINRDQDVKRSDFRPMPSNASVKDAVTLLDGTLTP